MGRKHEGVVGWESRRRGRKVLVTKTSEAQDGMI